MHSKYHISLRELSTIMAGGGVKSLMGLVFNFILLFYLLLGTLNI